MSQKLTPWFPGHIKPVRPGVYEREIPLLSPWYARFDGARWRLGSLNIQDAAQACEPPSAKASTRWRGLAEPPK